MTITGLMDEGHNEEYQKLVREAAWKGILLPLKDPDTNQVILRNEDVVEALLDIPLRLRNSAAMTKATSRNNFPFKHT